MAVLEIAHPPPDERRFAERVRLPRAAELLLVLAEVDHRVLDFARRVIEHLRDPLGGERRGGEPLRVEALDHEGRRFAWLPVEVVVAHVHEGGVRIQREPVAGLLVGAQQDLEVVARTETELRRVHLGRDVGASALGRAQLDLQHELLAGAHASRDAIRAVARDRGAARNLIDVGTAPPIDRVATAEERGMSGIGVADGVGEPARHLVRDVTHTLGAVARVAGEVLREDPIAHGRDPFAERAPGRAGFDVVSIHQSRRSLTQIKVASAVTRPSASISPDAKCLRPSLPVYRAWISTGRSKGVPPFSDTLSATVIPLAPAATAATPSVSSSTAATTPPCTRDGEPLCAAVNVHRARTSTDRGTLPGRRLRRTLDPFDGWRLGIEPTRACLHQALHPAVGMAHQEEGLVTAASAEPLRDRGDVVSRGGACVSVDVGHDHRLDELADSRREYERRVGDRRGVGQLITEKLGEPRRRRRRLGGLHRRQVSPP